jgi:DNA-binding SARP family transcriptional activator
LVLHIAVFGPPSAERDGAPVRFDTRKAMALLAHLAVVGGPHRREALAAVLWPGSESGRARAALRRTLSAASAVGPALRLEGPLVWLDPASTTCDLALFRQFAAQDGLAGLERAAALAQAPFMAGFSLRDSPGYDDWQADTAARIDAERTAVLARLAEALASSGDVAGALVHARQRLALDPLSEPAHVAVMRLLAQDGDRAAALRQYRSLVRVLDRELGVAPLPQTSAAAEAIRAGRAQPPAAAPACPAVRPSGAPVPLVERDAVVDGLLEHWRAAAAAGSVVGLCADAGGGRSAVLARLRTEAAQAGGRVLAATGRAGESAVSLGVLAEVLGPLLLEPDVPADSAAVLSDLGPAGGVPAVAPAALERLRLQHVRRLVAGSVRPDGATLLLLDDAHLVDPTSADVLAYLLHRMPRGVLAVVSWPRHGGGQRLPRAVRAAATVEHLPPLTLAGVAELLTARGSPADPALVLGRTAGLPRLVLEYAAADGDAARFDDAREIVAVRLAEAGPLAAQVLAAAVTLAAPAPPDLLQEVAGRSEEETVEALESCVRHGLLVEAGASYHLPHELVRQVVADDLGLARRRMLHRRAAEALLARGAASAVVAARFEDAGLDQAAARHWWAAAAEAGAVAAYAEQLVHLEHASGTGWPPAPVHLASGHALLRLGRYRQALAQYELAAAALEDDPAGSAEVDRRIAQVHARLGSHDLALEHLVAAAAALEPLADPPARARVAADRGLVLLAAGDVGAAGAAARDAVRLAQEGGTAGEMAYALNVAGLSSLAAGDAPEALAAFDEAVGHSSAADPRELLIGMHANRARALLQDGRPHEALADAERALALAREAADVHLLGWVASGTADALHALGRDDEAEALLTESAAALTAVAEPAQVPQVWLLPPW